MILEKTVFHTEQWRSGMHSIMKLLQQVMCKL
ncbi:hypothetical protein E2C01_012835 [Portunus trituberculatus]|uniref:Uncharacterized protein n=1 Tax=Portunus trituberculatus TaxID=210409 RepID=A0A5B7DF71_PORTR|nr:hypothetical protein [Portunus trituberculatus]